MKVDFIGDIHGHAVELEALLIDLGYNKLNGFYSHPENRKVVFVGDFIDRGLQIRETLQIVKGMCDNGTAEAVMGNHEYNAILFHSPNKIKGGYYRDHSFKEINHHYDTLKQFKDYPEEWQVYLDWFKTLPLFIETDNYRVVHAYWNQNHVEFIKKNPIQWDEDWLEKMTQKGSDEYQVVEDLLKGREYKLPEGFYFLDADKAKREHCRIKWWQKIEESITHGDYLFDCPDNLKHVKIDHVIEEIPDDKPILFGHYWIKEEPSETNSNAICLDYSVAKNGHLVAYSLDTNKLTIQKSIS